MKSDIECSSAYKKKLSNTTAINYFTTFLQTVDVTNFLLVSI